MSLYIGIALAIFLGVAMIYIINNTVKSSPS